MTTTTRQHESLRMRPAAPDAARMVEVRWPISPDALVRSDAAAALLNGHAAKMRACALVWRVGIDTGRASAMLEVELSGRGDEREEIAIEGAQNLAAASIVDDVTGLRTITVGDALVLVLRDDADHTLAYARTSLLTERLGLTGGVYDGPQ